MTLGTGGYADVSNMRRLSYKFITFFKEPAELAPLGEPLIFGDTEPIAGLAQSSGFLYNVTGRFKRWVVVIFY